MLPKEFGPWQSVYFYFRKWKLEGVFEQMLQPLRETVRKACGRKISPSVGLIDSRSVRTSHHIDSREYAIDGAKKSKEERNILLWTHLDCHGSQSTCRKYPDSVEAVEPIEQLRFLFP
jgi:putative transposase